VGVTELARTCGVHENTVRLHLRGLVETGLVAQETEIPPHRGRPGYRYRVTATDPVADASAYRHLSMWLAQAVRGRWDARTAGRRAGAQASAALDPTGRHDPLLAFFTDEGFAPRWETGSGGTAVLVLGRCPFATAAHADPRTICALHLGLAEGLAASAGLTVDGLRPSAEPGQGECHLRVRPAGER